MRREIWIGLLVALIIAGILSPYASPNPDGLEKVAETKGFLEKSEGKEVIHAPVPDYVMPGITSEGAATAVAGIVGTLVTFAGALLVGRLVQSRQEEKEKGHR